eukprot:495100-Hanusia_phi.AAC.1
MIQLASGNSETRRLRLAVDRRPYYGPRRYRVRRRRGRHDDADSVSRTVVCVADCPRSVISGTRNVTRTHEAS